jgi:hypothetical protein
VHIARGQFIYEYLKVVVLLYFLAFFLDVLLSFLTEVSRLSSDLAAAPGGTFHGEQHVKRGEIEAIHVATVKPQRSRRRPPTGHSGPNGKPLA